jgi:hypothetical protein
MHTQGESSEGEKNGQENLEEGKEAGSNEAVEVWKKVTRSRLSGQEARFPSSALLTNYFSNSTNPFSRASPAAYP